MSAPGKVLYFVVHVSTSGRVGLRWSKAYDARADAWAEAKRVVTDDTASLAVVVEFAGGKKTPMVSRVYPRTAQAVIRHWEDIWDATSPDQ